MLKHLSAIVLIAVVACAAARPAGAQDPPQAKPSERMTAGLVPLRVQIVISRLQGEKRLSSLPFTMTINANDRLTTILRMGAEVPIATPRTSADGKEVPGSYSYRSVGTSIDCGATSIEDGRYRLSLTIEDSSVYADDQTSGPQRLGNPPSFRSFRTSHALVLRNGETTQFTTGTDKISGEVIRVDVTMNVLK